jgi:DNA-binding MarR family transcriptional regulator
MWRLPTWLVNQVAMRVYRVVSEELARRDMHKHHFAILCALNEFGGSSQALLGRRLGIDRSDVVAPLDELEQRGLVRRTQGKGDRRRNTVDLKSRGRRELAHLEARVDDAQQQIFGVLSRSERDRLQRSRTRVLDHQTPWRPPPER